MNINAWLKSQDIEPLDDKTLLSIKEFIGGTQLIVAMESMEAAKEHYAFIRENLLTKREQFAGLAMTGLVREIDEYRSLDDLAAEAYEMADRMLEGKKE